MAKKQSKRQSRKTPAASKSVSEATMNGVANSKTYQEDDFNPDYSQTIKDLRRIGVLASTFFVVLIVLSFFLR